MTEAAISISEAEQQQNLNALELAIEAKDYETARGALRKFLFGQLGESPSGSLGEAIAGLAKDANSHQRGATVLLRSLGVPSLISANSANQISRHSVELCEKALPGLCNFLKTGSQKQNFEKFSTLQSAHEQLVGNIEKIREKYSTIDSILASKSQIQSGLKHGQVRMYLQPYQISEVADSIDSILAKLSRVQSMEPTFSADVDSCQRDISIAREWVRNNPSFLSQGYLLPFLDAADNAIDSFLSNVRGRIQANVKKAFPGSELKKRYPLHEIEREISVSIDLRNDGPGMATDVLVRASSDNEGVAIGNEEIRLGSVAQGDFAVVLDLLVIEPSESISIEIYVSWGELGGSKRKEDLFEVRVLAQRADIEWSKLQYWNPYSTAPAKGSGFIGRQEQIQTLVSRMLQTPMEATYIDGQKRVGKTSLAHAAVDEAIARSYDSKVHKCYVLWGNIAHVDPQVSLQRLGEEIEEFIIDSLPGKISFQKADYSGSLSPLIKLSAHAEAVAPNDRFVVIIDEFDEIPQELYLQGGLADTFFANIRAITNTSNICLLLVGGENMPYVMDRQGQKLNKFARVNLTYFSRTKEWADFERLVREPTSEVLVWHSDAVSEVFNITNGNPYFAKILCREVTARAVQERDADITEVEVKRVLEERVSLLEANIFVHLWQDGVPSPVEDREPIFLKRQRTLAALARCIRAGQITNLTNIRQKVTGGQLSEQEITTLLANFVSRDVLIDKDGEFRFALPIFKKWLVDVGLSRLANEGLAEELAAQAQSAEDSAYVLSEEIVHLTQKPDWLPYRGRHIGPEEVRAWISQCPSNKDQRILFKILSGVRIVGQDEVFARLRSAGQVLRDALGVPTRRSKKDRRNDVIVTYVDGEGKSGQRYAADFAEENKIDAKAIINPSNFRESYAEHKAQFGAPKGIVIIDDIAATGESLASNVSMFIEKSSDLLEEVQPMIQVYALFGTEEANARITKGIEGIDYENIDFRIGEILSDQIFAFKDKPGIFASDEEFERAESLSRDLGVKIYKKNPLGYGGMGMLLVLPMTVPNNSLPILHSHSKGSDAAWRPLFERITN